VEQCVISVVVIGQITERIPISVDGLRRI